MATSVAKLSVQLSASVGTYQKQMQRASQSTQRVGESMQQLAKRAALMSAAAATAAAATTAAMVRSGLQTVDALAKFSDRIGIATEALAGLQHAAKLTGVQVAQLEMGLQRMTRRIAEAAMGSGEAVKALQELGLDAQQLAMMSPDEQFRAIAEAMEQVSNQGDRVRLAMRLFDSEGVALVNTLRLGADGLREMEAEAARLGLTMSREQARAVEAANDSIARLKALATGLANQLAIALAPNITETANRLAGMAAQADSVANAARSIAKGIAVVQAVLHDLGRGVRMLWQMFRSLTAEILRDITRMVEVLLLAAKATADFVGLGSGVLDKLTIAATASREALEAIRLESQLAFGAIAREDGGVFDLAERFRAIDAAATSSTGAVESLQNQLQMPIDLSEIERAADALSELERFAERVYEQTRTPLEQFEKQMEKLREALEKGLIDDDTFRRAVEQAEERMRQAIGVDDLPEAEARRPGEFRQVRLSRMALQAAPGARRTLPQPVTSPRLDEISATLSQIAKRTLPAAVARG